MTDTFYTASSFSESQAAIEAALSSLITGYTGTNSELGIELTNLISRLIVTGTASYEIQVVGVDQYLVNGNSWTFTQLIADMHDKVGQVRDIFDFFNLLPSYETDFQLWNSDGSQILGGMTSTDVVASAGYKDKVSKLIDLAIQDNVGFDLVSTIKVVEMDTQDSLDTKYVIDGETLFSELSERGLDSTFKIKNVDAYFSTLTQEKDFLLLSSITTPQITFEYKLGSDTFTKIVSWNEIDLSESLASYNVFFNDFSDTSSGDDLVYGSQDGDSITDRLGEDVYLGFNGNDTFTKDGFYSSLDGDTFHGGYGTSSGEDDGIDTIDYSAINFGGTIGVSVVLAAGYASGAAQKADGTGAIDKLISIENIKGTNQNDILTGNNINNAIEGGHGTDQVSGGGGNDTFIGSRILGQFEGDFYDGGSGADSITYSGSGSTGVNVKFIGATTGPNTMLVSANENFSDNYDTLVSVEHINMTEYKDTFWISSFEGFSSGSIVDAMTQIGASAGQGDKLTFAGMAEGLVMVNGVTKGVGFWNFEELVGTSNTDKITSGPGAEQFNDIKTEAGGDEVISYGNGTKIDLGIGDDKLQISGTGSTIYTGSGNDQVIMGLLNGNNAYLADADSNDKIINFGKTLTGGSKWHESENVWSNWTPDGVKYGINQLGELVIKNLLGGEIFVSNFNSNPFAPTNLLTAGIKLYEIAWGAYQVFREAPPEWGTFHDTPETLAFVMKEINRHANPAHDPLVLDLDGDGIELTTLSSFAPQFDLNADGFAERTGWTSADDGMLAIDLNNNGKIDNGSELFGNATTGGLAMLAAYDSNLDGLISSADIEFSSLKVWRDLDQDGISDANELENLTDSGVQSISLTATSTTATTQAGNTIAATGEFTKIGGGTGIVGDVLFNSNGYDTKFLENVIVSTEIAAMANLKGHGTLPDLHKAMALDADLVTVVDAVLPTLNVPDLDALRANVIPFLTAWMASVDVPLGMPGTQARIDVPIKVISDPIHGPQVQDFAIQKSDSSGTYWVLASGMVVLDNLGDPIARPTLSDIQAQGGTWDTIPATVISFMERWTGLHMPIGIDGGETGSDAVDGAKELANTIWQELQMITVRLASQGGLSDYFEGISYDVVSDQFIPTTDKQLVPFIQNIFELAPGTVSGDEAWIASWKPLVDVVLNDYARPDGFDISYSYLFQNVVAAYENSPLAISLVDAAGAFSVPEDQIIIGTGTLVGTDDNDLFYLGEDNQTASGGKGPDSYIIGRDFGQDVIDDTEQTLGSDLSDTVRFAHLKSTDVTLTREQSDLIISVNGTTDQLRIVGEFATRYPSITGGFINNTHGVTELMFADGVVWDKVDMARESSHALTSNDIIYGTGQIDFLDGGAGNDHLSGSNSGDVYIYGQGYGQDVIEDEGAEFTTPNTDAYDTSYSFLIEGADILNLKDLSIDDVSFSRSGENNLMISVNGTTDTLLILNQFNAYYGVPTVGKVFADQIEYFSFSNGYSLSADEVMSTILTNAQTTGNDTIIGFSREDILDGGAGDDYLSGLDEADTYIFGRGYGHDTIFEGLPASSLTEGSNIDRLIIKDALPGDIIISRGSGVDDFKLTISDTGDSVTIIDQAKQFVSGPNFYEIEEIVFSNGTIWTTDDMQEQYLLNASTSGNDTVIGFMRDDVINGGTGNDRLEGRGGSDTYVFDANFGQDVIYDYPEYVTWNGPDTVEFKGTWVPSDFTFSKVGYDLVLQSVSTTDKLTIEKFFSSISLYRIENFKFSNGVILTDNDVYTAVMGGALITGTSSAETLTGNSGHNRIEGLEGNDILKGLDGNDILIGGEGDDTLEGGNDNDVYIAGSGADLIREQAGNDEIQFGPGITLNDLDIYRLYEGSFSEHLMIVWSGGSIKVDQQYYDISTDKRVELIRFDDGSTYNLVTNDLITKGSSAADTLVGEKYSLFSKNDTMYGYAGNDTLQGGNGNDILYGGQDDDLLQGEDGNDTLDGGQGNDTLEGGDGNDTYIHSSGNDTISESYTSGGGTDKILFETGIILSSLTLFRSGNALQVLVSDGSTITISNQYNSSFPRVIETLQFADGSTYSLDSTHQIEIRGTSANDTLNGNSLNASINDLIYGYEGNDTINGKSGDDFVYGGDGNDTLTGEDGADYLYGEDGADIINGENGEDYLDGGMGADTIDGGAGNDVVSGGDGNDIIYGQAGNDNISGGAGDDIIYETRSGTDVIEGGDGNDTLDYSVSTSAITINLTTGVQSDAYSSAPSNDTISGIENVIGGTGNDNITGNDVANLIKGGAGNDTINGMGGDDILFGGSGNDLLTGGVANDTASYQEATAAVTVSLAITASQNTVGAGTDTLAQIENLIGSVYNDTLTGDATANIIEGGYGNDVINGGAGIDTVSYVSSLNGVTVNLGITGAQDTYGAGTDTLTGIENITGSTFNDILEGDYFANTISGGLGNDVLQGGGGIDILDGGDGIDTVSYAGGIDSVNVDLRNNITSDDGTGVSDTLSSIENVTGSSYDDTIIGNDGANTLDGSSGNDIIEGGKGNDVINGGAGIDTVSYVSSLNGVTVNLGITGAQDTYGAGTDTLTGIENITGSTFNDILEGDYFANTISGGLGNDVLQGGGGIDILDGGDGIDTVSYAVAIDSVSVDLRTNITSDDGTGVSDVLSQIENVTGSSYGDTIFGNDGANTLDGSSGNDIIEGGKGNDVINGGAGIDTISYASATSRVNFNLSLTTAQFTQDAGTDTVNGFENILGSSYNDYLVGDANDNVIDGGAGLGYDTIDGGAGIDTISYASSSIIGVSVNLTMTNLQNTIGAGKDIIVGFENILGSNFFDNLTGDANDNVINGQAGNDNIIGGDGNDTLIGGLGDDSVSGGDGNDVYYYIAGRDTLTETGTGVDRVVFDSIWSPYNVIIFGNSQILLHDQNKIMFNDINLVETFSFSGFADMTLSELATFQTAKVLEGTNGNDNFEATLFIEAFNGGDGNDTVDFKASVVGVNIDIQNAYADGGESSGDTLISIENIIGSDTASVSDTIYGDAQVNMFYGLSGNDILEGAGGADILDGGTGQDYARYTRSASAVYVNLTTGINTGADANGDTLISIENLMGSSYADTLTGDALANVIDGGNGDDILNGAGGVDTLTYTSAFVAVQVDLSIAGSQNTAGSGYDTVSGFENLIGSSYNDILLGDGGDNIIEGGNGNDVINGGDGIDTISFTSATSRTNFNLSLTTAQFTKSSGTDTVAGFENILGSSYSDDLVGDANDNVIDGGAGSGYDNMNGGAGVDTISYAMASAGVLVNLATTALQNTVGAGKDNIVGFENILGSYYADTLTGDLSSNVIDGNAGNDNIIGGSGQDVLIGGLGTDVLTGGLDGDIFSFHLEGFDGSIDRIADFNTSEGDKLDISELLIGYDPLTSAIIDFISIVDSGSNSIVSVDRDGSGSAYAMQQISTLTGVTGQTDEQLLLNNGNLIVA